MKNKSHYVPKKSGFALIVTITLMALLSMIVIGLLSLSITTVRAANSDGARQTAEANARLALTLAIGELQKWAGLDTRITARADILDKTNPPILGVWKSWEGSDHELSGNAAGRPVSLGNYKTAKQNRFLAWLVSGNAATFPDTSTAPSKATLVGSGSVGSGHPDTEIHLTPVPVVQPHKKGAYAWWVGGENLKAHLPKPWQAANETPGQWATQQKSHAIADPKPFGLDTLISNPDSAKKAITREQIDLIQPLTPRVSQKFFYDISATSKGLLTNAATGGWKKDLSLFTEIPGSSSASNLPLFRIKPDQDSFSTLATNGNFRGAQSIFYPWSEYRGTTNEPPIYQHGAVASWNNLVDFTQIYKRNNNGKSIALEATSIGGDRYNFLHKVRVLPIIARIQWVYSHSAGPISPPTNPPAPPGSLEPRLLLTPVITMWNPYNLEISSNALEFNVPKPLPTALKFKVGGVTGTKYFALANGSYNYASSINPAANLAYRISSGFTLAPGETRVFSPTSSAAVPSGTLNLAPGYRSSGGHYFPLKKDDNSNMFSSPSDTIKAEVKFDTAYDDASRGVGIYLDMSNDRGHVLAYRMVYRPAVAAAVYEPVSDLATSSSLSNLAANPEPFLTTVFGARMASRTHIAAKGFVQSSPLVNYTAMGGKDVVESTIGRHYRGSGHPVNSPFDYSFKAITPNDSNAPGEDASNQRGFIVTGFNKADGLSRCVIAELPIRPLQSLAELQNWDMRYENPVPPFAFNLIGNSDATPLIAANEIKGDYSDGVNLQHDDSYCANHLLFDDWFFSSIAPDPTQFGSSGRDLKSVFTDFIDQKSPLPNHAYRSIPADSGGDPNALFTKNINNADAWKNVASRLEVEGMFNVNSTSVPAWRAILGHARDQKIPYMKESGAGITVDLSGKTNYAVSRFSVAGDSDTSSVGSSGAFPGANEFTGYRILDEAMIDALAVEIVNQVRQRGPFLSFSEFVNRQLSSGNLAHAGALQSALNEIATKNATNPYKGMTSIISRQASSSPPGGPAEYKFPEAAVGESTYGLPGWTRQADILRPLAPILSVRDDTFTIRAYGDARDRNNAIIATAVCEATVCRTRDYLDPADAADLATYPTSLQNQTFGRKLQIVSFRWLSPSEI